MGCAGAPARPEVLNLSSATRDRGATGTWASASAWPAIARIAYATYVGLLQMAREAPKSRMKPAEREDFLSELRSRLIDGS